MNVSSPRHNKKNVSQAFFCLHTNPNLPAFRVAIFEDKCVAELPMKHFFITYGQRFANWGYFFIKMITNLQQTILKNISIK